MDDGTPSPPFVSTPTSSSEDLKSPTRAEAEAGHVGRSKVHKSHAKAAEPSPRRQSSTPEISHQSHSSRSEHEPRNAALEEKCAQYERRIAELESLLDSSRRHAERLEKQLGHERAVTAEMEVGGIVFFFFFGFQM